MLSCRILPSSIWVCQFELITPAEKNAKGNARGCHIPFAAVHRKIDAAMSPAGMAPAKQVGTEQAFKDVWVMPLANMCCMAMQEDAMQGRVEEDDAGLASGTGMPSLRQEVTYQNFKDVWSKITNKEERTTLQPALVYQVCLCKAHQAES